LGKLPSAAWLPTVHSFSTTTAKRYTYLSLTQIKEASVVLANFAVIAVPAPPSDIVISPNSELIAAFFKDKALAVVYNLQGTMVAKIE